MRCSLASLQFFLSLPWSRNRKFLFFLECWAPINARRWSVSKWQGMKKQFRSRERREDNGVHDQRGPGSRRLGGKEKGWGGGRGKRNNRPSPSSLLMLYPSIGLQKDHTPLSLRLLYVFIAENSERLWEINTTLLEAMATSWEMLMIRNKNIKTYNISKGAAIVSLRVPGGTLRCTWRNFYERRLHNDEGVSLPQLLSYELNGNWEKSGEKEGGGEERHREGEQRWMTAQKAALLKETQINKSQMHTNPMRPPHSGVHTADCMIRKGGGTTTPTHFLVHTQTHAYLNTHTLTDTRSQRQAQNKQECKRWPAQTYSRNNTNTKAALQKHAHRGENLNQPNCIVLFS